jgi:diguanylate cyclase (GGDEF)-like protein
VTGFYLLEEYAETGSFSALLVHLRTDLLVHHFIMILLIPLMMILGHSYIKNYNLREKLRLISLTDELTGLYNRRGFFALAEQQLKIGKRLNREALLLVADMDNLKDINDTLGHKKGDVALIAMSNIFKKTFREADIIARIGGDEFAVITVETRETGIDKLTMRLQENIKEYNSGDSVDFKLSISMGVTRFNPENPFSIEELLSQADKLMYEQKLQKKEVSK